MSCTIKWGGFTLGGTEDGTSKLRALSTGGNEAITGLGNTPPRVAVHDRLVGGTHYGEFRAGERTIRARRLMVRDWTVATKYVEAMRPAGVLGELTIEGGPYTDPVVVYAYPMGAEAAWDVDSIGDRTVVHVTGSEWLAPDPTIYEATPEPFSGTGTSVSKSWTNPGLSQPAPGLGGRQWVVEIEANGTVQRPFVEFTGGPRVRFDVTLTNGQKLVVGPDRIPRVGSQFVVAQSDWGDGWVPHPDWPVFPPGTSKTFRVGAQSGTMSVTGELRGTW